MDTRDALLLAEALRRCGAGAEAVMFAQDLHFTNNLRVATEIVHVILRELEYFIFMYPALRVS